MMIYVVYGYWQYSGGCEVVGVYSKREMAEKAVKSSNRKYYFEFVEVDEMKLDSAVWQTHEPDAQVGGDF